jgi:phosphomannomutase
MERLPQPTGLSWPPGGRPNAADFVDKIGPGSDNRWMKQLIGFDLDGTLAPSKSSIDSEMAGLLRDLLARTQVAIISGGDFPQFQKQVVGQLAAGSDLSRLALLPTCGTKFFRWKKDAWDKLYSEDLSPDQKALIERALDEAVNASGFKAEKTWGPAIEDRGSQITYSALGQQAPLDAKKTWDPDFSKRKKIAELAQPALKDFSVRLGGETSIDVTLPGIDKAYGIRKLRDVLGISIERMLYVGDALFPGGNDYPARSTGVDCVAVRDPEDTKSVIQTAIAYLG